MHVKMTLSYDGSRFYGFQTQNSRDFLTVADRLQDIFNSIQIRSKLRSSGRTDRGVHATGAVIDIELPPFWSDLNRLKHTINKMALPEIYIRKIELVDDNFHSRFSAKRRVYRYIISTETPKVFLTPYVLFVQKIDEELIKEALRSFEGRYDFRYFKKSKGGTENFIRTIYKTRFYRYKEYYILYFEADGYLRSQIRMMVATILEISDKRLTIAHLNEQLLCKRVYCRKLVAPCGLYLAKVKY